MRNVYTRFLKTSAATFFPPNQGRRRKLFPEGKDHVNGDDVDDDFHDDDDYYYHRQH